MVEVTLVCKVSLFVRALRATRQSNESFELMFTKFELFSIICERIGESIKTCFILSPIRSQVGSWLKIKAFAKIKKTKNIYE